jgi:hypothetical protein|tara:strand:- start:404 stop:604 length:201 start_codon:yes stop_codon:yes gene_type:complete
MKIKEVRNGSLYQAGDEIMRVRQRLNSSSVSCSRAHSNELVAVKAGNLSLASAKAVESYLKEADAL